MATNYTTVLKLALPTTGELVGSWGSVVNNQITQMVEQAITGIATISTWSGASHTLTTANGSTSESRCAILQCSGAPGGAAEVICPAQSKIYIVRNGVTGGYAVTLKTSAGTGIAVPNGKVMWLYCDGTNVVEATNHLVSLTLATPLAASSGGTGVANSYNINLGGALSISGALSVLGNDAVTINTSANTNVTLPTSGTLITTDSADTITNKDISGLTNNIHDVSLTSDVIGTLPIANGGLGVTTVPTNGQIPIGNGSGYTVANITSGAGITVIGGAGSLQIAATGALAPGDVIGPASATDNALVRFDLTTGKIIQNSTATLSDAGELALIGTANTLTLSGSSTGNPATIAATGTDTNIEVKITGKGALGGVSLGTDSGTALFTYTFGTPAVNYFQAVGSPTGSSPLFYAAGSDSNVSMNLRTQGTGVFDFATNNTDRQFRIAHTGNAYNYVEITGGNSSDARAKISAQGSDTNVNIQYSSKNSGFHNFLTGGGEQFRIANLASAVNYLQARGNVTGSGPQLMVGGSDTDIDLLLTPKNAGKVSFGTYTGSVLSIAGYIEIKDSGGTIRKLAVVA